MATTRVSMRKIREILRLRFDHQLSFNKISSSCGLSDTTVSECVSRFRAAGLSWPLNDEFDDQTLESLLYQDAGRRLMRMAVSDFPDYRIIHTELRRKSMTLQLLWQEYKLAHPNGYQYSQFCFHYQEFKKTVEYSFRNSYKAGEKMFVDYAGQRVAIHLPNGEVQLAEIFIAVLGASSYTYAEATWSQQLPNWIASHVRAFEFFGGTPEILVPDNLKSAVNKPCRYDPEINPSYYKMASYYGSAVIPARPYRPKDKAKVEAAVLLVERWILAALRKRKFFSLFELNAAILDLLARLNNRPFKKMSGSRRDHFLNIDRTALKSLPEKPYEFINFKLAKVNINYHIELDGHHYSVPFTLVQKQVELRYSESSVEVLHKNQRVTSHLRSFVKGGYSTLKEHMPPSHQKFVSWTPERLIRWAGEAGEATAQVAEAIMASRKHPEQGFKTILGIIRLGESFGKDKLEAAARKSLDIGSPSYRTIKAILKIQTAPNRQDALLNEPEKNLPQSHDNIRGPRFFN